MDRARDSVKYERRTRAPRRGNWKPQILVAMGRRSKGQATLQQDTSLRFEMAQAASQRTVPPSIT